MLTMLLGGLWHGASWTFVVWGLYHGLLLSLHRAVRLPRWLGHPVFRPFFVAATFLAVCVGWVFFRAQTFAEAGLMLQRMAWLTPGKKLDPALFTLGIAGLAFVLLCYLISTFVDLKRVERSAARAGAWRSRWRSSSCSLRS